MAFRFQNYEIYKDLRIFTKEIYTLANKLPKQTSFELASQLRRASTSVLLNFSEGCMRKSDAEFRRFILISIGSVGEIVAIFDICLDQTYVSASVHSEYVLKSETIAKRLYGFIRKLKQP